VVHGRTVLELAARANGDVPIDVYVFAENAFVTNDGAFSDMRVMPDACPPTDPGARGNISGRVDPWRVRIELGLPWRH